MSVQRTEQQNMWREEQLRQEIAELQQVSMSPRVHVEGTEVDENGGGFFGLFCSVYKTQNHVIRIFLQPYLMVRLLCYLVAM